MIKCLNLSHYLSIFSKFVVFGKFCSLNPFCLLRFLSYISYMVVIIFLILCCCQEIQEKIFFPVITHKVMEMALLEGIQIYFILYGSFLMKTVKKKLWWSIRKSSCFLILFHYWWIFSAELTLFCGWNWINSIWLVRTLRNERYPRELVWFYLTYYLYNFLE